MKSREGLEALANAVAARPRCPRAIQSVVVKLALGAPLTGPLAKQTIGEVHRSLPDPAAEAWHGAAGDPRPVDGLRRAACASRSSISRSQHGEIAGLIGPNGSGKTTVFNVDQRPLPGDRGPHRFRRRPRRAGRPPAARHHRAGGRAHVPEPAPVQPDERAGERAGRHALPDPDRARPAFCWRCPARAPSAAGDRARQGAARRSSASACCRAPSDPRLDALSYANRRRLEIARALATDAEAAAARRARRRA